MTATLDEAVRIVLGLDGLTYISPPTEGREPTDEEREFIESGGSFPHIDQLRVTWWKYRPAHAYGNGVTTGTELDVSLNSTYGPFGGGLALYRSTMPQPTFAQLWQLARGGGYGPENLDPNYFYFICGTTFDADDRQILVLTGAQTGNYFDTDPDPQPPAPDVPPPVNPYPEPRTPDDGYLPPPDPNADAPEVAQPGSATVIDLVKAFSSEVRMPVRLTDVDSIEVVDMTAPLPSGWSASDGDSAYHATVVSAQAGQTVLSLSEGDMAVSASAQLVTDDMRLPLSDWIPPNRLPLPGYGSAHVQRWAYSFTPEQFSASIEFAVIPTPLIVRD